MQEQEKTAAKQSEMLAVAKHQINILEKNNAAYRAELAELDLSRSGSEIFPNLRRQLMHDVEQLRQCALSAQNLKAEVCIPVFDQDLSLDPSILALRHALKPISKIIADLMLALAAAKKLATDRARELRELEGEYAKLEQTVCTGKRSDAASASKSIMHPDSSSSSNAFLTPSRRQLRKESQNTLC